MERRALIPDFLRRRFGDRKIIDTQTKLQIARFQDKIKDDIADLFVNPKMEYQTLDHPSVDWKEHLPDTFRDNPHFQESKARSMRLTQYRASPVDLYLDFGRMGSINFSFDGKDRRCVIKTTYYKVRETMTLNDQAQDPVSEMLRLSRMSEGLDYYKAELAYREANGVNANQEG